MFPQEKQELPSNFCVIPWIHLNVNPNGDVFQCCISSTNGLVGNLTQESMEDIWNNDRMKSLRLQLLNGHSPRACQKCYEQEAKGIVSFRQGINQQYASVMSSVAQQTDNQGSVDKMTLRYWDFRFSNLCNMKCRMCVHDFSSSWHSDKIALDGPQSVTSDAVINVADRSIDDLYRVIDQQINNVEEIYFAGGEPLILDEHYYILEQLIKHGRRDVRLRYNTNLLKIRHKHWDNIDLWKNFDNVTVFASIDAIGPRAEYIRSGTVWDTINENIKRLIAEPAVDFYVAPTIQVLNLLHLPDLIDYLVSCGLCLHKIRINNVLTTPPYFHIESLSPAHKQLARSRFAAHVAAQDIYYDATDLRKQYDGILAYMDTDRSMDHQHMATIKRKFYRNIVEIDRIRGERFVDTFPELVDHLRQAEQQMQIEQSTNG